MSEDKPGSHRAFSEGPLPALQCRCTRQGCAVHHPCWPSDLHDNPPCPSKEQCRHAVAPMRDSAAVKEQEARLWSLLLRCVTLKQWRLVLRCNQSLNSALCISSYCLSFVFLLICVVLGGHLHLHTPIYSSHGAESLQCALSVRGSPQSNARTTESLEQFGSHFRPHHHPHPWRVAT